MKMNTSSIVILIAIIAIFGGMIWYSMQPGQYDKLAMCIKDSGTTFYGAFWCPHCQEQKRLFGKSASLLPYTECSTVDGKGQLPVCKDAKVETYPTWQFKDGTRKTGTLTLAELASTTGCALQ
jgi:thiol-disulfide isomerase/thioredoxin